MASLKRDVQTIVDTLVRDHGCTAKLTTGGHWRISRPGHQPITMSRTPSDQRALKNQRGDIRKYLGIVL